MAKARTLVGLDVHATKIVAAALDAETGQLQFFRLGGEVRDAAGLCAGLPRPVRAAYEAGPTGASRRFPRMWGRDVHAGVVHTRTC
jgi:transposase